MPIKLRLEADEYNDEQHAEDYTLDEESGQFVLTAHVEDVQGLRSALKKERQNARESFKRVKQMEEQYGELNMDDVQAMRTELGRLREQAPDSEEFERVQKHAQTLDKKLRKELKTKAVYEAADEHRAYHKALMDHLRDKVQVVINDEGTEARAFIEYNDDEISVSEYVAKLREAAYDASDPLHYDGIGGLFGSRAKSGGGTPPGGRESGRSALQFRHSQERRSKMTPKDKVAFIKQYGEEAFLKLPA